VPLLPSIKPFLAKNHQIILASRSPRRKQLLQELEIPFVVKTNNYKEPKMSQFSSKQLKQITLAKSEIKSPEKALIIACDTIVVYNGMALGKPENSRQARDFLTKLSGEKHQVISGLVIKQLKDGQQDFLYSETKTTVKFKKLDPELTRWYLNTGEWLDKAGGYGIQGKGKVLVKEVKGCYYNVVGLPIASLIEQLEKMGGRI
jgi:septum formation protein